MNYTPLFTIFREKCLRGSKGDIDYIMSHLHKKTDLPTTRAVDFFLGTVTNGEGISRIRYYLFHGSQIQRNYCTLFFARRNEWGPVNEACRRGLIDKVQAYSR